MTSEKADHKRGKRPSQQPSAAERSPRIVLAEDDDEMRALLAGALRREGCEVTEFADGAHLLDHLASYLVPENRIDMDLIISDIRMPLLSGMDVLSGVHLCIGFPPMILITAFGDAETHERAEQLGAAAVFDKPFEIDDLLVKVRELVSHKGTAS
jgi:DNA-binding response OmpR family regulator